MQTKKENKPFINKQQIYKCVIEKDMLVKHGDVFDNAEMNENDMSGI